MNKIMSYVKHIIYIIIKLISNRRAVNYLIKQYLYSINQVEYKQNTVEDKSDYVWSMWLQEDQPEVVQLCLKSIKKFYPELILITEKNVNEYIKIPDYIIEKHTKGWISHAHFSDYVRLCLLEKYGGLWIDSTCYLTQEIPKYVTDSDFFILQTFKPNIMRELIPTELSNFFIHAKKNNFIIRVIKNFHTEYWKYENKICDYFLWHKFCNLGVKHNNLFREQWLKIPISNNINAKVLPLALQKRYNKDLYDFLKNTHYLHKFTYREFDKKVFEENSLYEYLKQNT